MLSIGKPTAITYALWVGWGYWLWRYFSYYQDLENRGIAGAFLNVFEPHIKRHLPRFVFRPGGLPPELKSHTKYEYLSLINPTKLGAGWKGTKYKVEIVKEREDDGTPSPYRSYPTEVTIPNFLIWFGWLKAATHIVFRTHVSSEYILPYLVAAAPVVYWLWVNGRAWLTA